MSFDGVESAMWRLPGYADALERIYPGTRQRHADAGRAARLLRRHRVDDGVRRRRPAPLGRHLRRGRHRRHRRPAVDLGGAVVVAPFDAGPVRAATLRDPQGAVFSVNTYNPG